jgi:hypothetical protein
MNVGSLQSGFIPLFVGWQMLMGVAVIGVVLYILWCLLQMGIEKYSDGHIKHRQAWLEYRFGVEGARRWVEHYERVKLVRAMRDSWQNPRATAEVQRQMDRMADRTGDDHLFERFAFRKPDGTVTGTLYDQRDWKYYMANPPWGMDYAEPWVEHNSQRVNAVDWMAAGMWDRGVEVEWDQVVRTGGKGTFGEVLADPAFYEAAREEHRKREEAKKGQHPVTDFLSDGTKWAEIQEDCRKRREAEKERNRDDNLRAFVQRKQGS